MPTYPLAHDAQGQPIEVPEEAVSWRVRRQTGKQGRPGNVYGPDGAPLVVPIDASADDLRDAGCEPNKYRLDALDAKGKPVGVVALTEVTRTADTPEDQETGYRDALTQTIKAQTELIKAQGDALKSVAESVAKVQGEIMHSLAGARSLPEPPLPRGANLSAAADDDEEYDDERYPPNPQPRPKGALEVLAEQMAPHLPMLIPLVVEWFKSRGMDAPEMPAAPKQATGTNGPGASHGD